MTEHKSLITIKNCRIENSSSTKIENITWEMKQGQSWLVIGANGSGKAAFLKALAGGNNSEGLKIVPNNTEYIEETSLYSNKFINSTELVSLEVAARLIQEERENDESEYVEGGVDKGRTGRAFLSEVISTPEIASNMEGFPEIKLCGVEKFLDTGLKYMSTGQIRRTLLARALISGSQLLILSDPFAGLDVESRTILQSFFNNISRKQQPHLILSMERWHEIPDAITNVLEFSENKISFCGTRAEYEARLENQKAQQAADSATEKEAFTQALNKTLQDTAVIQGTKADSDGGPLESAYAAETLVEMHNVNVGWDGKLVLENLNWTLNKGQHWLVRGPNGCGKTTLLELITGDNMQVFSNDIKIFGKPRGSGESVWDIKKRLGIVSYRLHVEYRMLGGTSLRNVIISGFRDSIGLYGAATDMEIATADKWLALGGFKGRETESFGNLSYGEQRAVLILRSAVKSPEILILDEPCHGLDENYRSKILQLLEKIASSGTTTLLHVTHDPTEVLSCEKHILELRPGEKPMYKIINN